MKITRKAVATLALVAMPVVGALAQPASAADNGPAGVPGKSCAVEDSNGKVTQVPVGTRYGLLYCGRDGEWHVGWLVDEIVQPPTPPKTPSVVAPKATVRTTAVR